MNRPAVSRLLKYLVVAACIGVATSSMAQVVGSQGASWLSNKASVFYAIVASIAGILMTTAWTIAGYKFIFVEGTKLADLKGLLVGGVCCAGAATWSYTTLN